MPVVQDGDVFGRLEQIIHISREVPSVQLFDAIWQLAFIPSLLKSSARAAEYLRTTYTVRKCHWIACKKALGAPPQHCGERRRFGSVAFGTARAQGQSNLSTRAGKYCESCSKASPHGEVFAATRHLSHGERVALFNR